MPEVKYIEHPSINRERWNHCIRNSGNGLIYHTFDYLNQMASNWDALVMNDYEWVMPLAWRNKFGIRYLYQPAFFQQGGIVGRAEITPEIIDSFMHAVQTHFKFAEITLNFDNNSDYLKSILPVIDRNNFILPLNDSYVQREKKYSPYLRQRINRSQKNKLTYETADDDLSIIKLYKKIYGERLPFIRHQDYSHLESICKLLASNGQVIVRKVYEHQSRTLLATVLLLRDDKRIYNLISCILPDGKKMLANYFLYDQLIREFSETNLLLDFEGSDIPGIAYFYEKFSESNQPYPFIRYNNLPKPLRWLKK